MFRSTASHRHGAEKRPQCSQGKIFPINPSHAFIDWESDSAIQEQFKDPSPFLQTVPVDEGDSQPVPTLDESARPDESPDAEYSENDVDLERISRKSPDTFARLMLEREERGNGRRFTFPTQGAMNGGGEPPDEGGEEPPHGGLPPGEWVYRPPSGDIQGNDLKTGVTLPPEVYVFYNHWRNELGWDKGSSIGEWILDVVSYHVHTCQGKRLIVGNITELTDGEG